MGPGGACWRGGGAGEGARPEGSRGAAGLRGTGTARAAGPGARWKSPGCLGGRRDGVSGAAPRMPRPRAGGGRRGDGLGAVPPRVYGDGERGRGLHSATSEAMAAPARVGVCCGVGAGRGGAGSPRPGRHHPLCPFSPAGLRRWLSSRAPAPRICVVGSGPAGFYTAQHILKVAGPGLGPPR